MSKMFNVKSITNYFIWSLLHCLAVIAEAKVYSSVFYKVKEPNNVMLNISTSDQARSVTECAIKCRTENCICYSFNKQLQRCDMGNCKATNTSTGTSDDLYVTCDTQAGFRLLTSDLVTACVWESTNQVNYTIARDDCRARQAYLYTIKSQGKMILLRNIIGKKFWIGLNDIEVEGVYRWEDDNTICNNTYVRQIFATGEPNNFNNTEDCVFYGQIKDKLNDNPCDLSYYYVCETNFFNLL